MTRVKSLTRVIDFLFESSLSPAKNAKRLESDSDESLTRPNTTNTSSIAMTATIELQSARRKLQTALGDSSVDYFRQMKLWFRKHISKEIFDTEARRLLSSDDSHLHNEFLLAILNKCQTLANLPSNNVVVSSAASPVKLAPCPPPPPPSQVATGPPGELLTPRKYDPGLAIPGNERLRVGKVKRKNSKSNRAAFDQRFAPVNLANAAPDADSVILAANGTAAADPEYDRSVRYAHREAPLLPDVSLVHGRLLLAAWEEGLETVEDEAVKLVLLAVEQQLRKLVTALLMQRNGYKVREGNFPYAVGTPVPNPWLRNVQRRLRQEGGATGPREVAETLPDAPDKLLLADVDPLVPVGRPTVVDEDQAAALEDVCAATSGAAGSTSNRKRKEKMPISLFDLMRLLKQQKSIIPSHSVYAINMERIVSRLYHRGHDE
jgi:transcriptional adapter 1